MSEHSCSNQNATQVRETKAQLTRRSFLTVIATTAATIGLSGIAQTATAATKKYKVCTTNQIKVGRAKIFQIYSAGNLMVLITQPKSGVFRAFNPTCTHQAFQLSGISKTNLVCDIHGSKFDTTTGAVTNGPARMPLGKYTLTQTGTTLYISI
jgi:nitrite reductase/ring-hydroxylating ferredoxin subunit